MIRLSRQAWNNVLIVTMVVMILLFNSTNNMLNDGDSDAPQQRYILPEGSLILTIENSVHKVERIGRSWRITPPVTNPEQWLEDTIFHWQNGTMETSPGPKPEETIVMVVWLAGEEKGRVFELFTLGDETFIVTDNQRFRVLEMDINHLVFTEIDNA